MNFLVVLACTIAFSWLVRKPLKKHPVLFYLLAVALSIVCLVTALWSVPPVVRNMIFVLMQKCTLALAFFTVVLFFVRQRRADYPLVSLRVFESPRYTVGLVCTVLFAAYAVLRVYRAVVDSKKAHQKACLHIRRRAVDRAAVR